MHSSKVKECRVLDFNSNLKNFKGSFIIDGIDGAGKSTLCEYLGLLSYKDVTHHKFRDDVPCWWNATPSYIYKRLQFYIEDNIRIMNYLKENLGFYSMKGLLSTIAIHTFFVDRNYKTFLDSYINIFSDEVKMILVSCDRDLRKKRMYQRDKKTIFDLITLSDEYEEYYASVAKTFSDYVPMYVIGNSGSETELLLNFKNCIQNIDSV